MDFVSKIVAQFEDVSGEGPGFSAVLQSEL